MLIQEQVTNFKMTRLHRFLLFVLNIFVTLLVTLPVEGFYRTTAVPPVYCYKKQTPYSYSTKYRCDGYISPTTYVYVAAGIGGFFLLMIFCSCVGVCLLNKYGRVPVGPQQTDAELAETRGHRRPPTIPALPEPDV
ncbi:uncharacterized protein LOC144627224 isoform X1 [Crassostrea virginica]